MSKKSEEWFRNQCKKTPLKIRIKILLGMEFQLLDEENWYNRAKEVTDWIFEKEIPQYKKDFGIEDTVKCDYFKPYSKSCRSVNYRCNVIDGEFCDDRSYTEDKYPEINPLSKKEWEGKKENNYGL